MRVMCPPPESRPARPAAPGPDASPRGCEVSVVHAAPLRCLLVVAPGAEYPTLFQYFSNHFISLPRTAGKEPGARGGVGGGKAGDGGTQAGPGERGQRTGLRGQAGALSPHVCLATEPALCQAEPTSRRTAGQQVLHGAAAAGILPAPRRAGPLRCRTENMRLPVSWLHGPGMPASRRLEAYKNERCK